MWASRALKKRQASAGRKESAGTRSAERVSGVSVARPRKRDVRAEGAGITGQGALEEGFAQGIVQPGKIGIAVNANDQNGALLVAEITT